MSKRKPVLYKRIRIITTSVLSPDSLLTSMEVVGAVASIITLAGLAKEVWTLSTDLLRNYQNAPKELVRISNQTSLILLELECISQSKNTHGLASLFTNEEAWIFQQSLSAAKTSLAAIYCSSQQNLRDRNRMSSRIAWTFFDRKTVEDHLIHLQRTETSLCVILQVINMYVIAVHARKPVVQ